MNYPTFSGLLSLAARGGKDRSEMFGRNPEFLGTVPAGLIEHENCARAQCDLGGDLLEMKPHGCAVASRYHEGVATSAVGAHRTKQVGRLGALIVDGAAARVPFRAQQ